MNISDLKPGDFIYSWVLDVDQTEPKEFIIEGINHDKTEIFVSHDCLRMIDPSGSWSTAKSNFTYDNLLDVVAVSKEECIDGYYRHCMNMSNKWRKESLKYANIPDVLALPDDYHITENEIFTYKDQYIKAIKDPKEYVSCEYAEPCDDCMLSGRGYTCPECNCANVIFIKMDYER